LLLFFFFFNSCIFSIRFRLFSITSGFFRRPFAPIITRVFLDDIIQKKKNEETSERLKNRSDGVFCFFFCGWPKFLKEDMCLKTVPAPFFFFFLEGVASGKKNQTRDQARLEGEEEEKNEKKRERKKFKQKEIRHSLFERSSQGTAS
tara:strand:+ start:2991 stop:3431 length:441 start_codon:yes stop_codon:yes gene_type:complete